MRCASRRQAPNTVAEWRRESLLAGSRAEYRLFWRLLPRAKYRLPRLLTILGSDFSVFPWHRQPDASISSPYIRQSCLPSIPPSIPRPASIDWRFLQNLPLACGAKADLSVQCPHGPRQARVPMACFGLSFLGRVMNARSGQLNNRAAMVTSRGGSPVTGLQSYCLKDDSCCFPSPGLRLTSGPQHPLAQS